MCVCVGAVNVSHCCCIPIGAGVKREDKHISASVCQLRCGNLKSHCDRRKRGGGVRSELLKIEKVLSR